jgi:hypothetical protein
MTNINNTISNQTDSTDVPAGDACAYRSTIVTAGKASKASKASESERPVVDAVVAYVRFEAKSFDQMLDLARGIAAADAAADGADVKVSRRSALAVAAGMSKGTYSKVCKAGRATDDQVLAYLDTVSTTRGAGVFGLYNYLTPKASDTADETDETDAEESDADETAEEPASMSDADVDKVAADFIASLRTRGATLAQSHAVVAAMAVLLPAQTVQSVKRAA